MATGAMHPAQFPQGLLHPPAAVGTAQPPATLMGTTQLAMPGITPAVAYSPPMSPRATLMGTTQLAMPGITPAVAYSPPLSPAPPVFAAGAGWPPVYQATSSAPPPYQATSNAPVQSAVPPQPQGPWAVPSALVDPRVCELWGRIDLQGRGLISAADFEAAAARDPCVAAFAARCGGAGRAFGAVAEGKEWADFGDLEARHRLLDTIGRMPPPAAPRSAKRVFIISCGFGRLLFPAQTHLVERAGYQIHWCTKPPNPETPHFAMGPHLQQIKSELDQVRPDLVVCASKGGAYVVGLWEAGLWLGPTLMINAHPTCRRLPRGVPVVIAAGGDDEHYPSTRSALQQLVATGTRSHSFLYYAAGSGPRLPQGFAPRPGDRHNMDSLLQNDCLPRLMDAALCPEGAEVHMTRTHAWLASEGRLLAERPLREALLQRLDAAQRCGAAGWPASPVEPGSQEFAMVAAAFGSPPRAASAYRFQAWAPFEATRIAAVHRVEPRPDAAAAALLRLAELRGSLEQQGVPFEADVHTRWAFYHGCGARALSAGLQQVAGPWGAGAYFAREARHVVESGVCMEADGSRTVLMCLLASGLPCVGDAAHAGELPLRGAAAAYDCAVDSISSPELYVLPRADSAVAAYLITLA